MPAFHEWLDRVLTTGESVQDAPPHLAPVERSAVVDRLRAAFDIHALDVAGPPVAFAPDVAVFAAEALARACWLLASAEESEPPTLTPVSLPAAHLSADVTLRFLPGVYRRARLRAPDSALTAALDRLLRAWPLSGVLADLDGTPTVAPDFDHPGLQLLYAERLVRTRRAGWVPPAGPAREWAERVFAERGVPLPDPPKEDVRD